MKNSIKMIIFLLLFFCYWIFKNYCKYGQCTINSMVNIATNAWVACMQEKKNSSFSASKKSKTDKISWKNIENFLRYSNFKI